MAARGYEPQVEERLRAEASQVIARYPQARSALLPLLHLVQSEDGFVSARGIALCADLLGLTRAEVSAVATFYTQYKRHPNGDYTVGVCTNALCAVMGGDIIFDTLAERLGVGHDETTPDGRITLERVECNAACDYAPVVMVNWEFFDNQTPGSAGAITDAIQAGEPVRPTRGSNEVATFKEVSHVLAGFDDGRADEGSAGGAPTMRGLAIARAHDWHAPGRDSSASTARAEQGALAGTRPVGDAGSSAAGAAGDMRSPDAVTSDDPKATEGEQ